MSNHIYGSRSVLKKAQWYTRHLCIRTRVVDDQEKSASDIRSRVLNHRLIDVIRRRTQFTEEDEEHLCNWIAAKIPYKETGGRTGNRLYQQLCDMVRHFLLRFRVSFIYETNAGKRPGVRVGHPSHLAILA